jgi:hypothetical protein
MLLMAILLFNQVLAYYLIYTKQLNLFTDTTL